MIKIKKLNSQIKTPKKATHGSSGFDIEAVSIKETDKYIEYGTGLCVSIPKNFTGLLFPRSSISNMDLRLCNSVGVLDPDYTGELTFRFSKHGPHIYKIGDRIGQLVVVPNPDFGMEIVEKLADTERGTGGYGSTN